MPPAGAPATPPPWATPPAAPGAPAYPGAPAAQAAPPHPPYPLAYPGTPAAYPGAPAPATPGAPIATVAGIKVTPKLLAIGGIALAVIVAVVVYMNMNSSLGGITFSPSTVSCSSPVVFTATVRLPASVHPGDTITVMLDGKTVTSNPISADSSTVRQADGSWISTDTTSVDSMQLLCASGGSAGGFDILTIGTHVEKILDSNGKVLAQGSYTVKP
jgi:hypothetical protein